MVQGKARLAAHQLWSQMLVLPSPHSRAQQHIDDALEIGSQISYKGGYYKASSYNSGSQTCVHKTFLEVYHNNKKQQQTYILYINFILRQIMKLTLHLFVHFRHFSLVCSICRVHYVHNYISLHYFQKENNL
jgi:hypothetical protein